AAVDLDGQRLAVCISQQGLWTCSLAVDQPTGSLGIEADHPVPDDLQGHVAQQRRLRARAAVVDRSQRQQATGLGRVLAPTREAAKLTAAKIRAKGNGVWRGELQRSPDRITSPPRR